MICFVILLYYVSKEGDRVADLNNVSEGLKCHHINDLNRINCADCPYYMENDTAMRCLNKLHDDALRLLNEQDELLDELDPPKKWVVCKACGHKLRNEWNWCPWCRWEIRQGYTADELE